MSSWQTGEYTGADINYGVEWRKPRVVETYKHSQLKEWAIGDPTTLILVDEADRLHMNSLDQIRSIFDEGKAGLC